MALWTNIDKSVQPSGVPITWNVLNTVSVLQIKGIIWYLHAVEEQKRTSNVGIFGTLCPKSRKWKMAKMQIFATCHHLCYGRCECVYVRADSKHIYLNHDKLGRAFSAGTNWHRRQDNRSCSYWGRLWRSVVSIWYVTIASHFQTVFREWKCCRGYSELARGKLAAENVGPLSQTRAVRDSIQ